MFEKVEKTIHINKYKYKVMEVFGFPY